MLYGGVTQLRGEYLFWLASLCHAPPPASDLMRVKDFARLVDDIDRHLAEVARASQG